jgi:hypothetical protein
MIWSEFCPSPKDGYQGQNFGLAVYELEAMIEKGGGSCADYQPVSKRRKRICEEEI